MPPQIESMIERFDPVMSGLILLGLPREAVDKALCSTNRKKRREFKFTDSMAVQFVVLMGLFMDVSYDHLLELFGKALALINMTSSEISEITNSAVTQARQRIGAEPLKALFKLVCRPLCSEDTPYAYACGLRLVLIDGSVFQAPDTDDNTKEFGKSANQNGTSGLAVLNAVALIEYGSRVPLDVELGPYKKGTSEQTLCKPILSRLTTDSLVIGDRLYANYENCKLVMGAGSHFLFRVRKDVKLTRTKELPDGSYEARLYLYLNRKRQNDSYITVRVIEYKLESETEWHRLVTNLGYEQASVTELVRLYPLRWTEETVLKEMKTVLKPTKLAFRSKSPEMVRQEFYGLFIAYYLVRRLMFLASQQQNLVPQQLSFTHAVFVIRQKAPKIGAFSPRRSGC
jgi:hypothetical protein